MTKFYTQDEQGISFQTTRRIGDVRVPNYVYDIWMPLLGAVVIGVYSTYCRLEREGTVKGMNLKKLAKACRVGSDKLTAINIQLEQCGFITVTVPVGKEKFMHYSTAIAVHDAPQTVPQEIIDEYQPPSGYEPLTPWLVDDPENVHTSPDSKAGVPKQGYDISPNRDAVVEALILQPLDIEKEIPKKPKTLTQREQAQLLVFGQIADNLDPWEKRAHNTINLALWHWQPRILADHPKLPQALVSFVKALHQTNTRLNLPLDETGQKEWGYHLSRHLVNYELIRLEALYTQALEVAAGQNGKSGWLVGSPGALTKTMAGLGQMQQEEGPTWL